MVQVWLVGAGRSTCVSSDAHCCCPHPLPAHPSIPEPCTPSSHKPSPPTLPHSPVHVNPVPCTLHPQTLPPHTPLPLLTRPCERGVPLAKHEQFGVVRHDARGQLGCQLGTQEGAVLQVAVAAGAGAGASQLSGGCSTRAVAGAGAVAGAVAGAYKPCSHTPTSHIGIFEFNLNSIALLAWHSKTSFKP